MQGDVPKIADFGISRMLASDELASTATGTLHYMAPEILQAVGAGFSADLWSLGVMLYEILAGRLPFGDVRTPIGPLVNLICTTEPAPLARLAPEVPEPVAIVVMRALTKDPQQRYRSAREMIESIAQAITPQPNPRLQAEAADIRRRINDGGDTEDGELAFRALCERYPNDADGQRYLGEFLNRCQRHAEALSCFARGLELNPVNALLHWDMALTLQRMGRLTAALDALRTAQSHGLPDDVERHARRLLKVLETDRR